MLDAGFSHYIFAARIACDSGPTCYIYPGKCQVHLNNTVCLPLMCLCLVHVLYMPLCLCACCFTCLCLCDSVCLSVCVCVTVPSAVAGLAASSLNPSSIVVTWLSPGQGITHFTLNISEARSPRCHQLIFIVCPVTCLRNVRLDVCQAGSHGLIIDNCYVYYVVSLGRLSLLSFVVRR